MDILELANRMGLDMSDCDNCEIPVTQIKEILRAQSGNVEVTAYIQGLPSENHKLIQQLTAQKASLEHMLAEKSKKSNEERELKQLQEDVAFLKAQLGL